MKKIMIVLLMTLSIFSADAQAFKAKNFNIDVGYALGSHRNAFYSPGVLINFEKGVHKWVGVGAYTGYQYNINGGGIGLWGLRGAYGYGLFGNWKGRNYDTHSIVVGVSGSFHFYQMIGDLTGKDIKQDKLDIAVKPSFGVRLDVFHPRDEVDRRLDGLGPVEPRFDMGGSVVVRYFFVEKVGIYAELGYAAVGNAVIGVAFKL